MRTIGDHIRDLRELRDGMTQEQLAARAGISVDTVRRLEQTQAGAHMSTYEKIASALDVSLGHLLGQPTMTHSLPGAGGIMALRNAVQDASLLSTLALSGAPEQEAPSVADAKAALLAHQRRYQHGQFADLVTGLPGLVADINAILRESDGGQAHDEVWSMSSAIHIIAADVAAQLGHTDLAFMAVERALHAARRASDPLREALAVSTMSLVLLWQGRWEQAQAIAARKAAEIEPRFSTSDRDQVAMYGLLLLSAAVPASRADRADDATDIIRQAGAAAALSGAVRVRGTSFGPASVGMQATTVNVSLKRFDSAIEAAGEVQEEELPWKISRARHRLDVAYARFQTGDDEAARGILLDLDDKHPEWIGHQVLATTTAEGLLERRQRRDKQLRRLTLRLRAA